MAFGTYAAQPLSPAAQAAFVASRIRIIRADGWTWEAIAAAFGITVAQAQAISAN